MAAIAKRVIREPDIENPFRYAQRVYRLAWAYSALFFGSLVGIGLIIWKAQLYVTLSQRSNVETLTLAFFLLFFAYLVVLSAEGAYGAAHLLYFWALGVGKADTTEIERLKMRALGPPRNKPATVVLNLLLEREGHPGEVFQLNIADRAGSMGTVVVDGAELTHHATTRDGSDAMLAFFVQQANEILSARGALAGLDVVEWKHIDDEEAEKYLGIIQFARNLQRQLQTETLWPARTLTDADCALLERRLSAICPALRNENFLPHWEYAGEHKVPLIPEPLGLISLSRTEKRVDPLASMGCAVAIVIATVVALVLIILFPPWVPS